MTANVSGFELVASPAKDSETVFTPMVQRYKELESVISKLTDKTNNN